VPARARRLVAMLRSRSPRGPHRRFRDEFTAAGLQVYGGSHPRQPGGEQARVPPRRPLLSRAAGEPLEAPTASSEAMASATRLSSALHGCTVRRPSESGVH
jgi:hypothetical protein